MAAIDVHSHICTLHSRLDFSSKESKSRLTGGIYIKLLYRSHILCLHLYYSFIIVYFCPDNIIMHHSLTSH